MGNQKFEFDHQIRPHPAQEITPNQEQQAGPSYQGWGFDDTDQSHISIPPRIHFVFPLVRPFGVNFTQQRERDSTNSQNSERRSRTIVLIDSTFSMAPMRSAFSFFSREFTRTLEILKDLSGIDDHSPDSDEESAETADSNEREKLRTMEQMLSKKSKKQNNSKCVKRLNQIAFTRNKTARRIFAY